MTVMFFSILQVPIFADNNEFSCSKNLVNILENLEQEPREVSCCNNPVLSYFFEDSSNHTSNGKICTVKVYSVSRCVSCGTTISKTFSHINSHAAETCPASGIMKTENS